MSVRITEKTLSECLSKIIDNRGITPLKLHSDWASSGYRTISANNVKFDGLQKQDSIRFVDEKTYKKWMKDEIQKGDLLLTSEAPAGQVMYWGSNEKVVVGQRLFCLRTKSDIDSKYLKYYLQSYTGQREISKNTTGSTVFGISAKMFNQITVRLPDYPSQIKIGSLLYSLDEKISVNNQIIDNLDDLAKTIFNYWFIQFEFPNTSGRPYKSSGGKMLWNNLLKQDIPDGWKSDELSKYIDIDRGISYEGSEITNDGIPMINLNSFYLDGSYKPDGIKFFTGNINVEKELKVGDLMVATTDVTRNAFIIGKSFILPNIFDTKTVASCDIARVIVSSELDKYYLEMLFNSSFYHKYIKGYASGTLVLHLDTKGIECYKSSIPPKPLLDKYRYIKENIERRKSMVIKENQTLNSTRDWLLPMLMNGQVKVKSISES
ncbi:MAG: restriction endonuclease subunit S [bacterium]